MSYVAHDESAFAPPAEVEEVELYHPKTWVGKYVWSQDAKVIAVQYAMTAMGIGLVALVLSWLMRLQLGYPNSFSFINPSNYLQFVTMHGMIMVIYLLTALFLGGFGNYLIPLMVGARDMVFPYVNMVSYWVYLSAVLWLVAVPAPGNLPGHARGDLGNHLDARFPGFVHRRIHHGWFELCGDGVAGAHARDDDDAFTPDGMGHFHGHYPRTAGLSRLVRQRHHDVAGPDAGHEFLHARPRLDGTTECTHGRQSAVVPAPVLVLRSSRGLHRRPAGLRHRLRPAQCPCEKKHLRLSDDGVGDCGHRRAQFPGVGPPHVRQRNEPVLRLLFRHHHPHHRHSHGPQGLQLGADAVARQHPPHRPDAVCHRLHLRVHTRRVDGP